jgi:hypothetical protein
MQCKTTTSAQTADRKPFIFDLCVAALSFALYLLWSYHFRFQGTLADADMYRMLRGLLDGAYSGSGLASGLHYGKGFSFGYLLAMYRFADQETLRDPQRLIALINGLGFWSAAVGSVCFWAALWVLQGLRRATLAIVLFIFAPIQLEQGTSGHAGLVSFAFFSAAALLLFLPTRGLRAVFCAVLGSVLLLLALTMRADILLAFPFLVLARANPRSFNLLIRSTLLPALGPALAVVAFFLLKHHYVDGAAQPGPSLHEFFQSYYKFSHIPVGIVICCLGCGVFTVLLGILSVVRILREASKARPESELRIELLHASIGPLALLLPSLIFWIANPTPARHFVLFLAGLSMLAAWLLNSLPLPQWTPSVHFVAFGIVLANQGFGAATSPIILRHYPFKIVAVAGQPRVMPLVPIGDSVSFHRAVQAEMQSADAFAERVGGLCDPRTIVLSDHTPQISSHIYGWPGHWTAEEGKLHRFSTLTARDGSRTIVFLSVHEGWPEDPVAAILAEPSLKEYKLVRDPGTLSVFDKTEIPPNRAAHFGCSP